MVNDIEKNGLRDGHCRFITMSMKDASSGGQPQESFITSLQYIMVGGQNDGGQVINLFTYNIFLKEK